jgi:tripartite ATP-independent transporter DctP family solute receptor
MTQRKTTQTKWVRTKLGGLAAAMAAAIVVQAGTAQAAPKQMVISVIYGPNKPQAKIWVRMDELLKKSMPGHFKMKIVTNGALGGEKETTEGVRLGSIQGALSTLANLTTWVPEGAVFDMPFMFRDADHIKKVMSGPIGDEFKKKYEAKGIKVLGYIIYGARHVISKKPIIKPSDVKGLKMRVLQSDLHIRLWRYLGANPTPVPITEAYNALETGVVDYMDMTKSGYQALKLYEVVPQFTETGHIWALGAMYVGTQFWNKLSADEKKAMQAAADKAIPYFNKLAADEQAAALAAAVKKGAKVHQVDKALWQKAMAGFWKSYASKVGGMDLINRIVATK